MRCVQEMSVTAETEQGLRRLTTPRTFTCSPSVSRHCRVSLLCVDLGFHVVIGVGRLIVQRDGLYVNFILPRIRNSKYKVIFFWML